MTETRLTADQKVAMLEAQEADENLMTLLDEYFHGFDTSREKFDMLHEWMHAVYHEKLEAERRLRKEG